MKLPEKHRKALLRFAEFESKAIEDKDDTTLLMLHVALALLAKRDPRRVARIVAGAAAVSRSRRRTRRRAR